MQLDNLDLLISNLADGAESGKWDANARGLMADASATLNRYRTACHLADSIALVLDEAQALCEAAVPSTSMIGRLRDKGKWMQRAAREHWDARNASKLPAPRETPEDMAERIMTMALDVCTARVNRQGGSSWHLADTYERVCRHIAEAIREDRLDTEGRP